MANSNATGRPTLSFPRYDNIAHALPGSQFVPSFSTVLLYCSFDVCGRSCFEDRSDGVFGASADSRNTPFQAVRYGLT
jgi:hypothetical protein